MFSTTKLRRNLLGEEHPDVATSLYKLALLYHVQARYQEAEPLYTQALAIYEQRLGIGHPGTMEVRSNLADLYATLASPTH